MKILLLLVSAVAVFTADIRNFPDNPDGGDAVPDDELRSADQDQLFQDGVIDHINADESQTFHEESEAAQKEGERRIERGLRASQCEANVICGILGGSCIANNTVCSGWLVSEGCKGTNCKCCIPGSLEIKMKNFGQELQSLKEELTNSSLQQTMKLKSMIANITNTNAGLKGQIQSFTDSKINASSNFESQLNNLTQTNLKLQIELESIKADVSNQGCQKGTFWFAPSDQCFLYLSSQVNWDTAVSSCRALGLVLAKPYDPVSLRVYIVSRYTYTDWIWLDAKGTGSDAQWQCDNQTLKANSYLWYSGGGTKSKSNCLAMAAYGNYLKSYYNNPYYMESCTNINSILCEYIRK